MAESERDSAASSWSRSPEDWTRSKPSPRLGQFLSREGSFPLRRFVLPRFTYSILYAVRDDDVLVVAVAHAKRRPGHWRSRIASED